MTSTNTSAAARLCPRCQQNNRCAIALGQEASQCWCHSARFNTQRVAEYRGLDRCLCENCGTELVDVDTTQQPPSAPTTQKDSHGQ